MKTMLYNRYVPYFEIVFINLRRMPKEVIIAHELWGKLRAAFLALKNTFQAKDLLPYLSTTKLRINSKSANKSFA